MPQYYLTKDLLDKYPVERIGVYSDYELPLKLPIKDGMRILDVGCFNGRDLYQIAISNQDKTLELVGVDIYPKCVEYCKSIYPKLTILQANAENLPFKDKEFDIVFCNCCSTEFNDREKGIAEMHRIGKQVFVVDFNKETERLEYKDGFA